MGSRLSELPALLLALDIHAVGGPTASCFCEHIVAPRPRSLLSLPTRACGDVLHSLSRKAENKPQELSRKEENKPQELQRFLDLLLFLERLLAAGGAIKSLEFVSVLVACHS